MANLSDHIDLTRVQQGLDLLESFTNGLEHLAQMHEEQSQRWAALLRYLNPNTPQPDLNDDLADHDLFICEVCGAKLDIENSLRIEAGLVCPCCYYDDRRAL